MPDAGTIDRTRTMIYGAIVGIVALAVAGVYLSPENTISILGFCGVALTGLFTHLSSLSTAENVQDKVEEVKTDLKTSTIKAEEKTEAMADVLDEVHTLTNSQHGLVLESNATLARWKADNTRGHDDEEANEVAAVKAEKALAEHVAKQAAVDLGHK